MAGFFNKRLLINTGKGGVGKTTVSAAMATAFAAQGKRVLIMQLNARDRFGALFNRPPVGPEIAELAPNIYGVNTTGADALQEYALMILRVKTLYRAVFENRMVARLLRMMPGLPELTMLGKATWHTREVDDEGRPRWDVVIVDAPATGHGMFLLQIPQVITSAIHSGWMAEESRTMLDILEDPSKTAVNIVTLAEEMPVNETVQLYHALRAEFDIEIGAIIANAVFPRLMSVDEVRVTRELLNTHGDPDDPLGQLLGAGLFLDQRCESQAGHLARLRQELNVPVVEIPFYFTPELDQRVIERMGVHLTRAVDNEHAAVRQ